MNHLTVEQLGERISNLLAEINNPCTSSGEVVEEVVIGSILSTRDAFLKTSSILTPQHFSDPKKATVLEVCQKLLRKSIPIDFITVVNELSRENKLLTDEGLSEKEKIKELQKAKRISKKNKAQQFGLQRKIKELPSALDLTRWTQRVGSIANLDAHVHILHDAFLKRDTIMKFLSLVTDEQLMKKDIVDARRELAMQLKTSSSNEVFVVDTAAERQRQGSHLPESTPLLGSLISLLDITFFFALPKTAKTIYGVQFADAISKGKGLFPYFDENMEEKFLLENKAGPKKVLYIDLEMDSREFYNRTALQKDQQKRYKLSDNFCFLELNEQYCEFDHNYYKKMHQEIIMKMEFHQPDFLIIDNIATMTDGTLRNAKVAKRMAMFIKRLHLQFKCGILVFAHSLKRYDKYKPLEAADMRGASALSDLTKNLLALGKSSYDEDLLYIKHIFSRNSVVEYGADNVISCRRSTEGDLLHLEFEGLVEEKDLLKRQGELMNQDDIVESDIIKEGFNLYYEEMNNYSEIAREMSDKVLWSRRKWQYQIKKYAKEVLPNWDGTGEVPRAEPVKSEQKTDKLSTNVTPPNKDVTF